MNERPGLYIHIPFCRVRCGYCSFASGDYTPEVADAYLDALAREGDARAAGRPFATVYLGGGTPTALADAQLARLLALVNRWRDPDVEDVEFTVEANPASLTRERLGRLLEAGVNRVSLGVQTFREEGYAALQREGSPDTAREACALLVSAGVPRWSLDLISGWPGQTEEQWAEDLREAAEAGATHVSVYALQLDPDSPLGRRLAERGEEAPLSEEDERARWDAADEILGEAGLYRYEMGNFAVPGHEARHNVNYWRGGEYVGLGASAHSHGRGRRFANVAETGAYIQRLRSAPAVAAGADAPEGWGAEAFSERLDPEAKAREGFVFWLRLREGVDTGVFQERFGFTPRQLYGDLLTRLIDQGALERGDGRLWLSDAAYPVADAVLADLV